MRITEAQIRRIVREELESVMGDKMSILPPDVSPELFVKAYKITAIDQGIFKSLYDKNFDKSRYLNSLTIKSAYTNQQELSEQEAEEAIKLLQMCVDSEEYENSYRNIIEATRKVLTKNINPLLEQIFSTYYTKGTPNKFVSMTLYAPYSKMTQIFIKEMKNDINAEDLENQINLLTSLQNFIEPKQLSRSTLTKLKRMAIDLEGLIQAAELYSML
jgi:hypothetical protein